MDGFEVFAEPVESLFPVLAVLFEPLGNVFEGIAFDLAGPGLGLSRLGEQPSLLKNFEMLGDSRQAHLLEKRLGEV